MNSLRRLWFSSSLQTEQVSDDDVFPLHLLDDTPTLRGIVCAWTLRFDDVLDPGRLQESLSKLLNIGDWRKLGGRLRLSVRVLIF